MLYLVDGVHYLGLGVADADVVVEPLVDGDIDVFSDGGAYDGAVPGPVIVGYVGASSGEAHPERRLGDYHPVPPLLHDGPMIDVVHVRSIGWLPARSRQVVTSAHSMVSSLGSRGAP